MLTKQILRTSGIILIWSISWASLALSRVEFTRELLTSLKGVRLIFSRFIQLSICMLSSFSITLLSFIRGVIWHVHFLNTVKQVIERLLQLFLQKIDRNWESVNTDLYHKAKSGSNSSIEMPPAHSTSHAYSCTIISKSWNYWNNVIRKKLNSSLI